VQIFEDEDDNSAVIAVDGEHEVQGLETGNAEVDRL
jgi:hypothetical protein